MTTDDFASASQLLDLLRQKGARSFKGFGVEFEMFPAEAAQPEDKKARPNVCLCGHTWDEHLNGLCIAKGGGCDPLKCSPEA